MYDRPTMSRLPTLGPRGEGWVAIQALLLVAIGLAGRAGPAWDGPLRLVTGGTGLALLAGGGVLALRGSHDLRAALTPLPYPRQDAELVRTGVYAQVRHPIYGGLIIAAVGFGLVTASPAALVLVAALVGFFLLKSRREEAWLMVRYPEYDAYRAETRRLIPWIG